MYNYFCILLYFVEDLSLKFSNQEPYLENTLTKTSPLIVHGNGPAKVGLNSLGNYLPKVWNSGEGCISCKESVINLSDKDVRLRHFLIVYTCFTAFTKLNFVFRLPNI